MPIQQKQHHTTGFPNDLIGEHLESGQLSFGNVFGHFVWMNTNLMEVIWSQSDDFSICGDIKQKYKADEFQLFYYIGTYYV